MSDLYDADILEWSERQAALLRRVAAGDRSNDNAPDWPNIIEEIEGQRPVQLRRNCALTLDELLGNDTGH
jgi:hypothetical protein